MSKQKRAYDSVAHSATGRVDTSKKGGHRTWGSDQEQMQQGRNEFAASKGGIGGRGRNNDPSNARELNQMGDEQQEQKVSFAQYQKQKKKSAIVKPHDIKDKNNLKKRNARNRTQAQKTTDMLFINSYGNNNSNNNKNKKGKKNNKQNKRQNQNKNDSNKKKNRKAREVLMTSVTYEAAPQRGRGRGQGRGYGRGGGGGYGRGGGGYGGGRGFGRGGYRGRGGGFGSRGRGRTNIAFNNNNNMNGNQNQPQQPRQQYRKVDPSNKANTNNNNANTNGPPQ